LAQRICGYVFKSKSPSCGLENVKVYGNSRTFTRTGRGLFADALTQADPRLPAVEEKDLDDDSHLERFIAHVFAYARLEKTNPPP
jgi:uncharacterized protein YbbK (DUF523 family)